MARGEDVSRGGWLERRIAGEDDGWRRGWLGGGMAGEKDGWVRGWLGENAERGGWGMMPRGEDG